MRTAEDLMGVVVRAEKKRRARKGESHVQGKRFGFLRPLIEPPAIMAGKAFGSAVARLAPGLASRVHKMFFKALCAPRELTALDPGGEALKRSADFLKTVEADGRPCSIIALVSHPDPRGANSHLNFVLSHAAIQAIRFFRSGAARPRLVVAVDPFALETAGLLSEGLYAGAMSSYHLAVDRMPSSRSFSGRLLLRDSSWSRSAFALTSALRSGSDIGMVLAGGVPTTARLFYTVREWARRAAALSPWRGDPRRLWERLRGLEEFSDFEREHERLYFPHPSVWRALSLWLMSALGGLSRGHRGPSCLDGGRVSKRDLELMGRTLEALGVAQEKKDEMLRDLCEELPRETPFRERLFEVLARRLLPARRPFFLPLRHLPRSGAIEVGTPWAWRAIDGAGRLEALRAREEGAADAWRGSVGDFARIFVGENFA